MSNKIISGLILGAAISASVAIIVIKRKNRNAEFEAESDDENEMLDRANDYLLQARDKVEDMLKEAEQKSISILTEAGKLFSEVKEKTAELHKKHMQGIEDEADKLKKEIEQSIEHFRNNSLSTD